MPNFYEILGVRRSASAAEIRAAYIALIKRHHPDAVQGRGEAAQADSKDINRAFETLKDTVRRAKYDDMLDAQAAGNGPATRVWTAPRGQAPSRPNPAPERAYRPVPAARYRDGRRPSAARKFWVAITLLSAIFGLILMRIVTDPTRDLGDPLRTGPPPPSSIARARPPLQPRIEAADVFDGVSDWQWVAANGELSDAVRYSRSCFIALADAPGFRLFDRCAAFDLASEIWLSRARGAAQSEAISYLSAPERQKRHAEALARLWRDAEANQARLQRLERLTISEMAGTVVERQNGI